MEKTRVLFVSQEITPYLPETPLSVIGRELPQGIQDRGKEIRTFMPKYGCINERRNQLHEVIRLSGMNIIIDDTDHPLIIKVASIQSARMQVYFIDNDEYFNRKHVLKDKKGFFPDNDERAIFFARGVIETVKKLRWSPDVIHCHGWFTSLVPIYLKKLYLEDPLFKRSKIIYSVYEDAFTSTLNKRFNEKLLVEGISPEEVDFLKNPDFPSITRLAIDYSDAIIKGSEKIDSTVEQYLSTINKPILGFKPKEEYFDAFSEFYDKVVALESVS